ncbi:MAG: PIN/TRAM domain-containing protein [Filifactor alocis]|nr:PIN/TRAM domain-containing protein [Filifactor alocis]
MLNRIIRTIFSIIGVSLGVALFFFLKNATSFTSQDKIMQILLLMLFALSGGYAFYLITPFFMSTTSKLAMRIEREISRLTIGDIFVGLIGLNIGLIIAYFISGLVQKIPFIGIPLSAMIYVFFGYIGLVLSSKRKEDIIVFFSNLRKHKEGVDKNANKKDNGAKPKILDTSVIIDGRIADIADTGFVEGKFIVPEFVLEELRHIADSSDDLKRMKGRRGLDVLNSMQSKQTANFEISSKDFEDVKEVDMKLLKLAQTINGVVLTNDFNLNKVAQFQGVQVLNVNELANAVKPILLPGEELEVAVLKEGKEANQGIAYLDDGTMIVIEGGRKLVGQTKTVVVTSVLQTAAGRMIFARSK